MLNGIHVQNDPVNFIDPLGLLTKGQNVAIGVAATTAAAATTALATAGVIAASPVVAGIAAGVVVGAGLSALAKGSMKEIVWNGATGGLGGPFGMLLKGVPPGVSALGLLGDYGMDLLWAGSDPPWEIWPWNDDC